MRTRLITIIATLALSLVAWAQPYCTVRTFNIRDGLGANIISGIGQDNQQLMWFSTWNGLCCFDGYRFTTFRDEAGKDEVLTTNRLLMAMPNSENNIWCAAYDKHPYMFDTQQCKFLDIATIIKDKYDIQFHARKFYPLSNGYTWIVGTDGNNIRIKDQSKNQVYEMQLIGKETPKLIGNHINKVMLDDAGREWILTDKGTQIFQQDISSPKRFEYITQVGSKVYLATTDGSVAYYDGVSKHLHEIKLAAGIKRINGILKISSHQIAVATNMGISIINASNNHVQNLSVQNPSQASPEVSDLYIDSKQRIWAFGTGLGATLINAHDLSVTWIKEEFASGIVTTSEIPLWVEDKYHTVWLSPSNGYFGYYDENKKVIKPYSLYAISPNHSSVVYIKKWFVDKQKNLWLASSHDLTLLNLRTHKFKIINLDHGMETRSVCTDKEGNKYFGTVSGNLIICDKNWNVKGYLTPTGALSQTPVAFDGKLYALFFDKENRLWIGCKGGGLYIYYPNGEMRHYVNDLHDKYSISSNDIYSIAQDNLGYIWIGSYGNGLNLVKENPDKSIQFINKNNELPTVDGENYLHIRRVTYTKDGVIAISTTDGLVTFSNQFKSFASIKFYTNQHIQGDSTTLATSDVMQTLVMKNGSIFVATMAGGLQEIISSSLLTNQLKFKNIPLPTSEEGIIQSLAEDNSGNLWITRESSLDMYNPKSGKIELFGPNDLGDHTEFCEALPSVGTNGEVILCIMNGAVAFNPQKIKKSNYKPTIVFSSILYPGEPEPQPILYTHSLEIPANKRSFTINFAALDYLDNSMVRYAYKLEGIDKEWNYINNEHSVSYNHFPAGKYKLLVKSTNADGVWVDNVKELTIKAQPTFWESIWAKILYLLIAIGIIYAASRYYVLHHIAIIEHEMNQMKTKFFTEIGHKLRTPLTLIGGPVTEVLSKEKLTDSGRQQMEMVQRNSRNMLELVNSMLEHNSTRNYFVDDNNAPVFMQNMAEDTSANNDNSNKDTRILIVEDNHDLRAFLVSILNDQYTILQADNGKKGLEIAIQAIPDFIITDVMMPVMDGLTMIHQIKQNKNICHIPIVVLSAKASLDDRLQGLSEGIDDYITKPFSATYLRHRVENIIAQRKILQQSYLEQIVPENKETYKLEAVQIVNADKEMMNQLMAFLEENIGNTEIKVDDLANAVHLGRTVFYEKMRSIVGMSPIDFLRHIRLQRAEELVAKSTDTFSQIAYSVGFTDPKYFGKCFKKETGMTPSEYREKAKNENNKE